MKMIYIRNKREHFHFCAEDNVKIKQEEKPTNPFESCGNCKYASHGFMCYQKEGDCLRTFTNNKYRQRRPL